MFSTLGSLGIGIGTDLLSEAFVKKLDAFRDEKAVKSLIATLHTWEMQFEQTNDGTVITSKAFYDYVKYHKVVEGVLSYVLDPTDHSVSQENYLKELQSQTTEYLEEKGEKKLSHDDKKRIAEYYDGLLTAVKEFLFPHIPLQDRGLLYALCQNGAQLNQIKQILSEHFQMQEQAIAALQEQFTHFIESCKAEDNLLEKLNTWNKRMIGELGERYNPKINIPLDISEVFQGAAADNEFQRCFLEKTDQFLLSMRGDYSEDIQQKCSAVVQKVTGPDFLEFKKADIDHLCSIVDDILAAFSARIDEYHNSEDKKSNRDTLYQLYQRQALTDEFRTYLTSASVQAAVTPYVVLTGDGGVGKSHLIADYIENRMTSEQASLLLLSQSVVSDNDILSNLPTLIGCDINYYAFFERLEKIALSQQSRVLICIDALNEGLGVKFWGKTLAGIVEFLKGYPHIGLVVSVRTQYEEDLFAGYDELQSKMQRVEHTGFSQITYEAMNRFFSFYDITTDTVIFPSTEFSNPLFLRLFCKSHRHTHIRLEELSLPAVYRQYIDYEEGQIAQKCNYHKAHKLVSKILEEMITRRTSAEDGSVMLSLDSALNLIVEICKSSNVISDVYSALLGEGILTQITNYDGSECVHITYERLEDYFIAKKTAVAYTKLPKETFLEKYSWTLHRQDLLEFLGVILAEKNGIELFEIPLSDNRWEAALIRNAFLYGLEWRKSTSFMAKTVDYINHEIIGYKDSFRQFIDLLFALSARSDHPLNAIRASCYFQRFPMPDRDANFIPIFDELYENHNSALYRMLEWGLHYSNEQHVPDDVAKLSALNLCWLLISPNTELRDRATKTIICILYSHTQSLISLLQIFEKIDDPYILERLYAIAFGCAVNEENPDELKKLAEYVYTAVFDKDSVYPNILLRTYAKDVIDYAKYMGCIEGKDIEYKIAPPYRSIFPDIPSDEEIKQYEFDYNDPTFKDHFWAQNTILNSMRVEYSRSGRPGGYGDFGRYTFQNYFRDWKQLRPMDLKNIAIKRIFELGYDVEKHGHYDRQHRSTGRNGVEAGKRERIGKKYQWIALYELAAQVSDHYPMTIYDNTFADCDQKFCPGSFVPNIRNIDPTVLAPKTKKSLLTDCHVPFVIPGNTYKEWLSDFSDAPSFERCVSLQHEHQQYLLLAGDYNWTEPKRIGSQSYDFPRRYLWHQIRGYFVKSEHVDKLLQGLKDADFMTLRMPEPQSASEIYNKEFYWSDANTFFKSPYYGSPDWTTIEDGAFPFKEKIMVSVREYYSERRGDLNSWDFGSFVSSWYKPCDEIFAKLHLRYAKGNNCQFVDSSGELICFDSCEVLGDKSGFYIRQDKLQEFLHECGYSLVWTSLSEKQVLSPMQGQGQWDLPPKAIHMSAVYCYEDERIVLKCQTMIEDKLFR